MEGAKKAIKTVRSNWDDTFMMMALVMAKRAACKYHAVASIFVDENHRIVATGYNGPTVGDVHCLDVGCAKIDGDPVTKQLRRCRGAHSEINAIVNAGNPAKLKNATLFVTGSPCYSCMKILNNVGVKRIVYFAPYVRIKAGNTGTEDEFWEVEDLAKRRGIVLEQFSGNLDIFKDVLAEKAGTGCGGKCDSCK